MGRMAYEILVHMKSIPISDAASNLKAVVTSAQRERVVLTQNGKPAAVVVGIESYDEEDLRLAGSAEFWKLIESRRRSGSEIPLAELKQRFSAPPKKRSKASTSVQKRRRKTRENHS
jgi:prevent-host-death family protein